MRSPRSALASIVTAALMVATAGMTVAQAEADPDAAPVGVVIESTWTGRPDDGQITTDPSRAFYSVYDRIVSERWEATDPRLSGEATYRGMRHEYPTLGYFLESFEQTLVNEEGSWVGTGTGIASRNDDAEYGDVYTMALRGAGAYAGLVAYLTAIFPYDEVDTYVWRIRGLIVEDELPPFPEPSIE